MSVRSRGIDVDRELANDGPLCVGSCRSGNHKAAAQADFPVYDRLPTHCSRCRIEYPPAALAKIWAVPAPKMHSHPSRFAIKSPAFSDVCNAHVAAGSRVLGERYTMAIPRPFQISFPAV